MARPKSTKPNKDKILSVRLTTEDYMRIKKVYGSIQKFLDLMVKTLPIVILIACKAPEIPVTALKTGTPEEAIVPTQEEAYEIDTWMYSKMVYGGSSSTYFAYKIHVKCNEFKCFIIGHIYESNGYQYSVNSAGFLTEQELVRSGNISTGRVCLSTGDCFDAVLTGTSYFSISDGIKCHKGVSNSTEAQLQQAMATTTFIAQRFTMARGIASGGCPNE